MDEALSTQLTTILARLGAVERRLDILAGDGSDMAEGGVIGRLKKEHEQNTKTLSRILWLAATTLVALLANLLTKFIK